MGDQIIDFKAYDVEDSSASASEGLHLSSRLEYLRLYRYPPLPSLSLPSTLRYLSLRNMCPLPSSISDDPLPFLLENITVILSPFSDGGKTSTLRTPLDFSPLTRLTKLFLDGGEETSNLVSPAFFSTLKNATAIYQITLQYCMVDAFHFRDFIRWFFGDWRLRAVERGIYGQEMEVHVGVRLFYGDWREADIASARMMMREYANSERSGISESEEQEKYW
ncbi:hypothetical protein BT69DRAFT_1281332 [Atractiella rhizophila]|nr:hypothetical protein BT69DRAFT_1281332 [Atractiella rhizophila]